jgi:hypothetical protein
MIVRSISEKVIVFSLTFDRKEDNPLGFDLQQTPTRGA